MKNSNKTDKNSFEINSKIKRLTGFENSLKIHSQYLKIHPDDNLRKELIQKVRNKISEIKKELELNSIFFCPYCKKIYETKKKLINHVELKHGIRSIKCPFCTEESFSQNDYIEHEKTHFLEVDLHGLYLRDSIWEIKEKLNERRTYSTVGLKIIHGFHHGQVLKEYFRSNKFVEEMKNSGFKIKLLDVTNDGFTIVSVEEN